MKYLATINGKKYEIEVERLDEYRPLSRGERARQEEAAGRSQIQAVKVPQPEAADGEQKEALRKKEGGQATAEQAQPTSTGKRAVESPLIGKIVRVLVSEGQHVNTGDTLLLIEALKMETEIVAPVDGTVSGIAVEAGQQVEAGTKMLEIG